MMAPVAETVESMPRRRNRRSLRGSFTRAIVRCTWNQCFATWHAIEVRAVVAGHGDQHVGAARAYTVEEHDLGAVAVHDHLAQLLAQFGRARAFAIDEDDLVVAAALQLEREPIADGPRTDDDDVHR